MRYELVKQLGLRVYDVVDIPTGSIVIESFLYHDGIADRKNERYYIAYLRPIVD